MPPATHSENSFPNSNNTKNMNIIARSKYVTCTQSQHPHRFTEGRVYQVKRAAFGPAVVDDLGLSCFIGRTGCHTSSTYLQTNVTRFKKASIIERIKHWVSPVPTKEISENHKKQLERRAGKHANFGIAYGKNPTK